MKFVGLSVAEVKDSIAVQKVLIFAQFLKAHLMTCVPLPSLLGYRGSEVRCADVGDGRGEPVVVVLPLLFLAPLGALGVTLSVLQSACPCVCPAQTGLDQPTTGLFSAYFMG